MALVVAHRHVVSTSFEGAALLACNGLPPPSCRGGSQEHVRVAWMSGGVLRWQGACARCVGFRQLRVGGRCYRKPPPTAVARVWSGQPKSSIINVRAIGERALRWVLQAVTKTGSRGTPTFHRPARTTGSDGLSVTPQLPLPHGTHLGRGAGILDDLFPERRTTASVSRGEKLDIAGEKINQVPITSGIGFAASALQCWLCTASICSARACGSVGFGGLILVASEASDVL